MFHFFGGKTNGQKVGVSITGKEALSYFNTFAKFYGYSFIVCFIGVMIYQVYQYSMHGGDLSQHLGKGLVGGIIAGIFSPIIIAAIGLLVAIFIISFIVGLLGILADNIDTNKATTHQSSTYHQSTISDTRFQ
ncbi:hypothetical protein [Francisella philomiragia]|uniref:hypothetical protein n=1 Tax=Francisella philomiragia TaxID=28110 RepID=UPI00190820A0|nr:hypothetical protein [Francisella philomiragia]MBK2105671.1 hypothetical protein [Francisella philomiragia]